jgi:hypothetical protein
LYGYTRLPVLQRVCSEVSADLLSYKRHFSYLPAGFRQFSDMSNSGSSFRDEDIQKEKGKLAVIFQL